MSEEDTSFVVEPDSAEWAASPSGKFIPCSQRELPEEDRVEAAKEAIRINPANRPVLSAILLLARFVWGRLSAEQQARIKERLGRGEPPEEVIPPAHIAMLTSKYWGPTVDLDVCFLDTQDAALKSKILSFANHWGAHGNIRFRESSSTSAKVRIARQKGRGYWSYLGTDVTRIRPPQPTMNLDSFSLNTPESEYFRIVEHEFGHTLGFPHEHMRQEIVSQLDPQKTVAYFGRTQGWSPQEVYQQVLTPLDPATLTAAPTDELSIMCYQLPGSITKDGQPIPGGAKIDAADAQFVAGVYPKAEAPAPEPPVPPAGTFINVPKAGRYKLVE